MDTLSSCCLFCCANPITNLMLDSIARNTLNQLEITLEIKFFPIPNDHRDIMYSKYYRPKLLELVEPKTGFVNKTIYKQQLVAGISKGLKQANVSAWSVTSIEAGAISSQLTNLIFTYILTGEMQFNYVQNLNFLTDYEQLHPNEVKNFRETIRSFPNGSQVDLKTVDPVEHKALDIQIIKVISAALEKLDIAEATATSINTFRSQSDMQRIAEMFENNSSGTTSRI